jgi:parallel beta-helix repeat protein/predicted outer membrane repeat protein
MVRNRMKEIALRGTFLVWLATCANAASINVSDTITTNTEWNSDTVVILNQVAVDSGITLTIKPGVTVLFERNCALWVYGTIIANGTVMDSIYFTARDTAVGWHGIRYHWTDSANHPSSFSFCDFSYGKSDSVTVPGWEKCGGALFFNNFNKATVKNCSFHHNYASATGGALYCANRADIKVSNCTFWNNSALWGGAIGIFHICSLNFENCAISSNMATKGGGGIFIESNDGTKFVNCIITGNTALEGGGAVYIYFYSFTRFYNCTICNNSAGKQGGAFYFFDQVKPKIANTIIWNKIGRAHV